MNAYHKAAEYVFKGKVRNQMKVGPMYDDEVSGDVFAKCVDLCSYKEGNFDTVHFDTTKPEQLAMFILIVGEAVNG